MSDILLSGLSGLSFDSPFLSPLLFFLFLVFLFCFSFCTVLLLFLSCHCFLLMVHSPDFNPQKPLKYFSLRVRLVCMTLAAQLRGGGRWYVQLAAIGHWYLPLCIDITLLNFVSPFHFVSFFSLVSINQTEQSTIPACPSLMCSFNRGNIEGTNYSKICV